LEIPAKTAEKKGGAMHSVHAVFANLVLLIGFLMAMTRPQVVGEKTLNVDGGKQGTAATVVKAVRVNPANSSAAGTPAAPSSSPVIYFDSRNVKTGFAKGQRVLYDGDGGKKNYEVHMGRRDGPAMVDIHTLDTDIYHVVDGMATFVTGGTVVNPKTTRPNEMKGTAIEGGETYHLSKGDVIIIPKGVPHWTKEVQQAPFLYLVVKVR
jgi:mannose-6-phosphate isomerase-like protein (cupin superfamily)